MFINNKSDKKGMVYFTLFLLTLISSTSIIASDSPYYCLENKGDCHRELEGSDQTKELSAFGSVLFRNDFHNRMENYAFESLLSQKAQLLKLYPNIAGEKHHSLTDRIHSSVQTSGFLAVSKKKYKHDDSLTLCLMDKPALQERIEEKYSDLTPTDSEQKNLILSSLILGAIASEKSIENLPKLEEKVSDLQSKLKKHNKRINAYDYQLRRPGRCHTLNCYEHKEKKIKEYKAREVRLKEQTEKELNTAILALGEMEKSALSNSLYIEDSQFYQKGRFRKSPFVEGVMKEIRALKSSQYSGDDFIKDIQDGLINHSSNGFSLGLARIANLLEQNDKLNKRVNHLAQKQMAKQLKKLDEGIEELCEEGPNQLLHHQDFMNNFRENLSQESQYDPAVIEKEFNKSHCSLLERYPEKGVGNSYLIAAGVTVAGAALGAVTFGAGAAVVALSAGSLAIGGVGAVDLYHKQSQYDISNALSEVKLEKIQNTRKRLSDLRTRSALVGLDAALMPLGVGVLKTAAVNTIRSAKSAKSLQPVSKPSPKKVQTAQKEAPVKVSSPKDPSQFSLKEVNTYFKIDKIDKEILVLKDGLAKLPQGTQQASQIEKIKELIAQKKNLTDSFVEGFNPARYKQYKGQYIDGKGEGITVKHVEYAEYEGSLAFQTDKVTTTPKLEILKSPDKKKAAQVQSTKSSSADDIFEQTPAHQSVTENYGGVQVTHYRGREKREAIEEFKKLVKDKEAKAKEAKRRQMMKEHREENIRSQGTKNIDSQNRYMAENEANLRMIEYTPAREASPFYTNSEGFITSRSGEVFLKDGKPLKYDQLQIDSNNFKDLFYKDVIKPEAFK